MRSRDPRAIPARRATRPRTVVWIAILLALRFSLLVLTEVGTQSKGILEEGSISTILADASRYQRIVQSPGIPYKNFEVEYPPVGLGAIEAVGRGSIASTRTILGLVGFALDGVTVLVLLSGWGEGVAIAYLVLGTSLALFAYYRIDFLAVALSVLAIDLMRRGKDRSAGLAMSLAVFTKIWPLAVAPVFVARRRQRALLWFVAASVLIIGGWLLVAGWRGPEEVLGYRGARGWQIESLVGAVLWTSGSHPRFQSGAWRVGATPGGLEVALLVAAAAVVTWVWALASRGDRRESLVSDGLAAVAAVGAVMVAAPVLSPQYATWLLPWAAIATGSSRDRLLFGLALGATTLTALAWFLPLPRVGFQGFILLRNAALIGIVAVAGRRLRAAASGSAPGRRRAGLASSPSSLAGPGPRC